MKQRFAWAILLGCSLTDAQTVQLESAREMDLDGLRGLWPATTHRILQERERLPFGNWRELMQRVPGIGPKKAAQLSEQGLRVQGQPYLPSPPRAQAAP